VQPVVIISIDWLFVALVSWSSDSATNSQSKEESALGYFSLHFIVLQL